VARRVKKFKRAEIVYSQGDAAKSVMYLQEGGVKLSVVNEIGKEAVVAILGPGDFFGEGCLAGQCVRMGTATAIRPSTVLAVEKEEMFKVLGKQHAMPNRFIEFMLARNIRIEEDLKSASRKLGFVEVRCGLISSSAVSGPWAPDNVRVATTHSQSCTPGIRSFTSEIGWGRSS
jgi:CRP-like cAMP-binding protein